MRMTVDKETFERNFTECQTNRDRLLAAMRDAEMKFNA
jgi:hypothetical protein